MTCNDYQKLLSAWLDGELSGFEEQVLCDHLDRCPLCRSTRQVMRRLQERIDDLQEPEPPMGLWEQVEIKLTSSQILQEEWIVTARGRLPAKTERRERLCLRIPFNHPALHSSN